MSEKRVINSGSLTFGILLILAGIAFLLERYLDIDLGRFTWPIFIIAPGVLTYLVSLALPEETGKGVSAAGSIVTMVGLILLYQNTTGHYESWTYAWALIAPTSLGLGWIVYGLLHGSKETIQQGLRLAGVGLAIFLVAGAYFELVVGNGGRPRPWVDDLWPVLLILLGIILLARNFWNGIRARGA